jgi:hypothetical protein
VAGNSGIQLRAAVVIRTRAFVEDLSIMGTGCVWILSVLPAESVPDGCLQEPPSGKPACTTAAFGTRRSVTMSTTAADDGRPLADFGATSAGGDRPMARSYHPEAFSDNTQGSNAWPTSES